MAGPIRISVLADTKDIETGLERAESSMDEAAATARTAGDKIDRAFGTAGEGADQVASASAQAAGGLGDIAGALEATGLISEGMAQSMETGAAAIMGVTGAADLANFATEKLRLATIRQKAAEAAATITKKASAAASKAMAAAQWALNAAMSANPIALVVIAIAALVAAFILAYKKSETFRNIVNKAFGVVKNTAASVAGFFTKNVPAAFQKISNAASKVLGWVKGNWPKILAVLTGPFGLAVLAIAKNWDRIKSGASAAKDFVVNRFNDLVGYIRGLPGKISSAASGMFNGIENAFRGAINFVIDGWNRLSFTMPSVNTHIPGVGTIGGWTLSTPDIPRLAKGGIVTGPTFALIGDNPGGREAVIPLDKYSLGNNTYEITVVAPVGSSKQEIGREIVKCIDAFESAGGRRRG